MNTFQTLILVAIAVALVLLSLLLLEMRKVARLRKPLAAFSKIAGKALEVPIHAASLMEQHLAELSSLHGNALMSRDVMEFEFRRREEARAKATPASGMPETGTVKMGVEGKVPEAGLFGAGADGGKVVEVAGRVDMGDGKDRPLHLGAASGADGTAA